MGFAIVSEAQFPSNCPAFGNIVADDVLRFALRANDQDNFLDLSDNDWPLTNSGAAYNAAGMSGNGTSFIEVAATLNENSFTMYSVAKVDMNTAGAYDTTICGNFSSSANGGVSIRILSGSDPNNAGRVRITARASLTHRVVSSGSYGTSFAEVVLQDNLVSLPSTTGWFAVALRFDLATRLFSIRNLIGQTEAAMLTNDANWVDRDHSAAVRNGVPATVDTYRVLRGKSSTVVANNVLVGESFYHGKALSLTELGEQLAFSRSFMLNARGVTLP